MPAEQKKLLWLSLSVCAFVLVLAATGLFLFAPQKGGATAPATLGNVAAPKSADPQDFLMTPPPTPSFEEPRSEDGDVVVIYGEKPEGLDKILGPAIAAPIPALAPAAPRASTETVAPAAPKTPATAIKPTAGAAPAVAAKAQAPKKAKTDEYWIQAASFMSRGRADDLKEALAAKGVASLISVKDIDGKSWYRVRIGPYPGKPEAEGWLGQLKGLPGCSEAYISKTVVERNG
jgi:DedD protein